VLGPTHAYTVSSEFNLMRSLVAQKKDDQIDPILDAIEQPAAFKTLLPDQQGLVLYQRGSRLMQQDKPQGAETRFVEALALLRKSNHPSAADSIARVLRAQIALYEKLNRPTDADKARGELAATTQPATQPATRPAK
jgi:hypothetical protein